MEAVTSQVQVSAQRVILLQVMIAGVAALGFALLTGGMTATSAVFGGLISVCSSLLLRRGVLKAEAIADHDPKKSMLTLYIGAVQRFVLVLAMFGIGLGLLKLDPLAAVVGFGSAQLAYVVVMRRSARPGQRK